MRDMPFANATVLAFESRRAKEMAELIRINGGEALVAPALTEVPLEHNQAVFDFADRLYAGGFDMVIFLTGVGARYLHRVLTTREPEQRLPEALRRVAVVARGPKPSAVLREWQVPIAVSVPEPNTWRELLEAVRPRTEKNVAIQEYGRSNPELLTGLQAQGRVVTAVPVYQWRLPDDTAPLAQALQRVISGEVHAALFTTGVQVDHFLDFAGEHGKRKEAVTALQQIFIASIGPDTTEALKANELSPVLEPSHPKMGLLVREAAEKYGQTQAQAT